MAKQNNPEAPKKSGAKKSGNGALYGIGGCIIAATVALAVGGTMAATHSMRRNADAEVQAMVQSISDDMQQKADQRVADVQAQLDEANAALESEQSRYTNDQIDWMRDERVRYNDEGFPVDENGMVVDDPTTAVNEMERYEEAQEPETEAETETEKSEEDESETGEGETEAETADEDWWKDNPAIEQAEDGTLFHTVKSGETLGEIAMEVGYDSSDVLADYNKISNPSEIEVGQIIKIPPENPKALPEGVTPDMLGLG